MIVVSEALHPDAWTHLTQHAPTYGGLVGEADWWQDRDTLKQKLENAKALIVRNQTQVNEDLLVAAPSLKVVGRVGVGLDNLEQTALQARNIMATWAPGTNAASVAEYVLGTMLELSRRFSYNTSKVQAGHWDRQGGRGIEVLGKTLGIIGLGDIGTRLAKRAQAFGMTVIAHDPVLHASSFAVQEYGILLHSLEDVLARSDYLSLHAPLLPSTKHLINAQTLEMMKPSGILINTSRGGLVDERALAQALADGKLSGAALDVREQEPPTQPDPLAEFDNVILTPHVAGVTFEASRRTSMHVVEDVLRVLNGERPMSPVPGF
ncbi:MAG: hydroxyacid dehydrogenase [Deinococcota bacterium]